MKIRVSRQALTDLDRLQDWLIDCGAPGSASRAAQAVWDAIDSLAAFPHRARILGRKDRRELVVRFGRSAYLVQYRIEPDQIVVARIRHSRERR